MNLKIEYPETPTGARKIAINRYGNVNGYVGTKKFWEFGCGAVAEKTAEFWANGATLEAAYNDCWVKE